MRKIVLLASAAFASGILFVNIYSSIVNAAAFEANIPDSIVATREFFKTVNPGNFFKIFSPLTQVLALLATAYFHPRNDIMFMSAQLPDTETLRRTASE